MSDKIRPIYHELRGCLAEAPTVGDHGSSTTRDKSLWLHLNNAIDELNKLSENDYSKFKVSNIQRGDRYESIFITEYRNKLGALITRLYGTYFYTELSPLPGMPSTNITVSNQQSQQQSMVIDLQNIVDEKLKTIEPETSESNFLKDLKNGLSGITGIANLMLLLSELGEKYNLTMKEISTLLGT